MQLQSEVRPLLRAPPEEQVSDEGEITLRSLGRVDSFIAFHTNKNFDSEALLTPEQAFQFGIALVDLAKTMIGEKRAKENK